jgi:signal transduction histidine kinase
MTGDEYRLEQAISNLLSNAHKYGGKNPIEISLRLENERALLEVKDQGIGIPEENLDSIFERYERAPTAKNISGLGLGLYISQQIANAHGGKISVKSKVGKGSILL